MNRFLFLSSDRDDIAAISCCRSSSVLLLCDMSFWTNYQSFFLTSEHICMEDVCVDRVDVHSTNPFLYPLGTLRVEESGDDIFQKMVFCFGLHSSGLANFSPPRMPVANLSGWQLRSWEKFAIHSFVVVCNCRRVTICSIWVFYILRWPIGTVRGKFKNVSRIDWAIFHVWSLDAWRQF